MIASLSVRMRVPEQSSFIPSCRKKPKDFNLFGLIPSRLRRNFFCRVGRQGYRLPTRIETREQRERVTAQPLGTRRPPCGDKSAYTPPLGAGVFICVCLRLPLGLYLL